MVRVTGTVVDETSIDWAVWSDPALPAPSAVRFKLLVSRPATQTDSLGCGVAEVPVGERLVRHHHAPAEIYRVESGQGVVEVNGAEQAVGPGSVVFIPGNAVHGVRQIGPDPLHFLFVFPVASFEEVVYVIDE